jgi:hypothetical protein
MPTILRENGFRFYFFSHEPNEPPHVHIDRAGASIKVWLTSITVAKSRGFRGHEIDGILALVASHQLTLLEAWHEFFSEGDGRARS